MNAASNHAFKRAINGEPPADLVAVYDVLTDCWLTANEVAAQVNLRTPLARLYCSRLAKLGILDEVRAMGGARYRVSKRAEIRQPVLVELIRQKSVAEACS